MIFLDFHYIIGLTRGANYSSPHTFKLIFTIQTTIFFCFEFFHLNIGHWAAYTAHFITNLPYVFPVIYDLLSSLSPFLIEILVMRWSYHNIIL